MDQDRVFLFLAWLITNCQDTYKRKITGKWERKNSESATMESKKRLTKAPDH